MLIDSLKEINQINYVFHDITGLLDCPPLQSEFQDVLNTGLCDQMYKGFWSIWISQNITTALVLICTLVVCITYEYFGKYWNNGDTNDDGGTDIDFERSSVYGDVVNSTPALAPFHATEASAPLDESYIVTALPPYNPAASDLIYATPIDPGN